MNKVIVWAAVAALLIAAGTCLMHKGIPAEDTTFVRISLPEREETDNIRHAYIKPEGPYVEAADDAPAEPEAEQPAVVDLLGTLVIDGKEIPIARGIYEDMLKASPGWMPESALPGESGMCVIFGHRNKKHLRPLENAVIGDGIRFVYVDGREAKYNVAEIMVYENTAEWRLPSAAGDTLVLATCWPFSYSGSAPGKYMALCRLE